MWQNFDGKPYSREQFLAHLETIPAGRMGWCQFLTVHNTAGPTIEQWCSKVCTPAQRIINLENYYEHSLGWHAGPHGFVPPNADICLYGFTNLDVPGVHASCFNSMSIGLEMVGDFDAEDFNSGLGALVKDNAIFVLAALHRKRGLRPDGYKLGVSGLHFHVDCKRDNHACPGKTVSRDALVASVLAEMDRQSGGAVVAETTTTIGGAVAGASSSTVVMRGDEQVTKFKMFDDPTPNPSPPVGGERADKPSMLSFDYWAPHAAKVNELSDQGSRIGESIRTIKGWFHIGGTATVLGGGVASQVVDTAPGSTGHALLQVIERHWPLLAIGAVVLAAALFYFSIKRIEAGLVSAYAEGRYKPRGA